MCTHRLPQVLYIGVKTKLSIVKLPYVRHPAYTRVYPLG
jgi:hypothetical protein